MLITEYGIKGTSNLTIAVAVDLHEHNPAPVLSILRSVQPDAIAVPGDLLERWKDGVNKDHTIFSRIISTILHAVDYFQFSTLFAHALHLRKSGIPELNTKKL